MSQEHGTQDLARASVIIPALNECENLARLLPTLAEYRLGQIIVCDNGSTDDTRHVVQAHGALWVYEPRRGYGAACYAGMNRLSASTQVVVFLDADLSDDPTLLPSLVGPILRNESDFVLGSRVRRLRERGSMTFPQRVGNALFPALIQMGWGHHFTDLAPFRAIRRTSLDAIDMRDRAYGWTIEMQIRAVELGLRIHEIPVPYRKRGGRSKISGTVRGVFLATYWITRTCFGLWFTKRRRHKEQPSTSASS